MNNTADDPAVPQTREPSIEFVAEKIGEQTFYYEERKLVPWIMYVILSRK